MMFLPSQRIQVSQAQLYAHGSDTKAQEKQWDGSNQQYSSSPWHAVPIMCDAFSLTDDLNFNGL